MLLWHDNGGSSPSWYLSHVVVKDLVQGSCWFFLGQCWLAVEEGDGRVERSLVASESSLTFKQVNSYVVSDIRLNMTVDLCLCSVFKGIVHPEITILSSFTHPHVIPNLYAFNSSAEHRKY